LLARPAPASVGEKWAHGCLLSVGVGNQGVKKRFAGHALGPGSAQPASIDREASPPTRLQPCRSGTAGSNRSVSRRAFSERRCARLFAPLPPRSLFGKADPVPHFTPPIDAVIVGYLGMAWRCRRPSTPHPSPPHFLITQPTPRQTKNQLGSPHPQLPSAGNSPPRCALELVRNKQFLTFQSSRRGTRHASL
jgi:hypothetical protein